MYQWEKRPWQKRKNEDGVEQVRRVSRGSRLSEKLKGEKEKEKEERAVG